MPSRPPLGVVTPYPPTLTETFIRAHIERLPTRVVQIQGWRPSVEGRTILPFPRRVYHKLVRMATRRGLEAETTAAYRRAIRVYGLRAILAEYGETGVLAAEACELERVPLIVHFHGYDASHYEVLAQSREGYQRMFQQATAIVTVSRSMNSQLIALGAPPAKVHLNSYGANCDEFHGAEPSSVDPLFLSVARFTEKKGPALTLQAFARVAERLDSARLRMIGDGDLLPDCRRLAADLGIGDRVEFRGALSHDQVCDSMRSARCFVQHSRVAASGDSEGTPVSILEAQASGLPIVATRHGGIPDIVVEGETGFLVAEGDFEGMAARMLQLGADRELAGTMGRAARRHILANFTEAHSLAGLWNIILNCVRNTEAAFSGPGRTATANRPLS